jgi:hypothetical protein
MALYGSYGNSRYPTPPQKNYSLQSFPNDLVAPGRNFYTELTFMTYAPSQQLTATSIKKYIPTSGGIRLPIPRKINDTQTLSWSPESATSAGASVLGLGGGTLGSAGKVFGAGMGISVNPLLFMTFQKPNYKEHSLSWSLIPSTEQESYTLRDIINYLKKNSLPTQDLAGAVYKYPNILYIKLAPSEVFTMTFRPCAVTSVNVDYTGAGAPSFFRNGAPTVVNLTINLTEIQLWDQTNYEGGEGINLVNSTTNVVLGALEAAKNGLTEFSKNVSDLFIPPGQ